MTRINQIWVVLLTGWSKFQAIRSTTQIYVVSVHQYGILRSFLRRHFAGKPVVAWRNVGCFLRLTNSVNVVMVIRVFKLKEQDWVFRFNFFGQNDGKPCLGTMERSQGKFLKSYNEYFHMNLWRQFRYKKKPNYSSTETFVLCYIKDFKKTWVLSTEIWLWEVFWVCLQIS